MPCPEAAACACECAPGVSSRRRPPGCTRDPRRQRHRHLPGASDPALRAFLHHQEGIRHWAWIVVVGRHRPQASRPDSRAQLRPPRPKRHYVFSVPSRKRLVVGCKPRVPGTTVDHWRLGSTSHFPSVALPATARKDSDFSTRIPRGTDRIIEGQLSTKRRSNKRGSFSGIGECRLRADLRQLSECVYLSPAEGFVGLQPALVGLPECKKPDRLLRQHPRTELAYSARTLPAMQSSDFAALSGGRAADRVAVPGLLLALRADSGHAEILHARLSCCWG